MNNYKSKKTPPPLPRRKEVTPPPLPKRKEVTPPPLPRRKEVTPPPLPKKTVAITPLPKRNEVATPPLPRRKEVVTPPLPKRNEVVTPPPLPRRTVSVTPPLPKRNEVVTPPPLPRRTVSVTPPPLPKIPKVSCTYDELVRFCMETRKDYRKENINFILPDGQVISFCKNSNDVSINIEKSNILNIINFLKRIDDKKFTISLKFNYKDEMTLDEEVKYEEDKISAFNQLVKLLEISGISQSQINISTMRLCFTKISSPIIPNFTQNIKMTSGSPWCHELFFLQNLSEEDYELWIKNADEHFQNVSRKYRQIAFSTYKKLESQLLGKDDDEQMEIYFRYVQENYKYAWNDTIQGRETKSGHGYVHDPFYVYENGEGVCDGRSMLLKIMTNNYWLKLPCFIDNGMVNFGGETLHVWNVYIDRNGNRKVYDLSGIANERIVSYNVDRLYIEDYQRDKRNKRKRFFK